MSVRQWISFTDRQNVCQAMNFVHWQTKCLSGNEFRPLTDKMSVSILNSFTDRQNVCQAMNFVHWQTKCLSGNEFRPLTDKMSVTYLKFIHWQTKRLCEPGVNDWALVLLTDISSVSDTEKSKNLRKITKFIDWQTPVCQCDDLREDFACTDRHFICQSMNLSSLTEEKSVSNEQRVKSNEQRVKEQWCEDIREHLIGDIHTFLSI